MNNFWGEPDEEPLPNWMNPETYRKGVLPTRSSKSMEEIAAEILKKPPVPILLKDPTKSE
jgi:hypothetical protein